MSRTTIILLLADIIMAASGQLLLKKGMLVMGPIDFALRNIPLLFVQAIRNGYIWLALILYGTSFIFWLFIISKLKLSMAYPAISLVYIFVIFGSWFFFKETLGAMQLVGAALILLGLFFLFFTR